MMLFGIRVGGPPYTLRCQKSIDTNYYFRPDCTLMMPNTSNTYQRMDIAVGYNENSNKLDTDVRLYVCKNFVSTIAVT